MEKQEEVEQTLPKMKKITTVMENEKAEELSIINISANMLYDIGIELYEEYKIKEKRKSANSAVNALRLACENKRYYIECKYL